MVYIMALRLHGAKLISVVPVFIYSGPTWTILQYVFIL